MSSSAPSTALCHAELEQENRQLRAELAALKQMANSLRDSEKSYRLLFESNPHPMWVYDLETLQFVRVNEAAIEHYGYTRDEFLGMSLKEIRPPEDIEPLLRSLGRERPGVDRAGIWRHRKKDGTVIDVEITCHRLRFGGRQAVLVLAVDVSERLRAENALRNSDFRFRTLFESAPDAIYLIDLQGRLLDGNHAAEEMVGYPRQELIGKDFVGANLLSAEQIARAAEGLQLGARGERTGPVEYTLRRKDGTFVPVEIRTLPVRIQDQCLILGVARDLTERKRAEAALRASEANLTTIFNAVNVAIFIHNREGTILAVNDKTLELYQVDPALALTLSIAQDYSAPSNSLETLPAIWDKVLTGESHAMEWLSRRPSDGSTFPAEVYLRRVTWDGRDAIMATVYDLTEKKNLQKQLLRAQRLESIGTLAAGIAHDLNNILTPITLSAQLLETTNGSGQEPELIASIQASAHRGGEIVRQVLTYARGVEGRRVAIHPKHLIKEMQEIVSETFPKNIEFRTIVPSDVWSVTGDATQLHQVLINLCVNARDAMPQGGTLQLSASNVRILAPNAGLFGGGKTGPHVLFQVSDTGTGIPAAIVEKIFDPFYTTKELGKGTGLGLSTVLGIVRSHGGFIDLQTEEGRGSTFKAYLPANASEASSQENRASPPAVMGQGECILFVDDETSLRSVAKRALSRFGYEVMLAANGQEALDTLRQHRARIQAIITDIMMPVMDGLALAQAVKSYAPTLPVIACTGLDQEGFRSKLEAVGVEWFLEKPYSAPALLSAVRKCLHS